MLSPSQVYQEYLRLIGAQQFDRLGEVVDLEHYTENCLGLTGWTVGFALALRNFQSNILSAFSDMSSEVIDTVEGTDAVVVRARLEGRHTGTFLGGLPTGRLVTWDNTSIVHVANNRIVGQWIQPDLAGIHQQITASEARNTEPARATNSTAPWARSAR